MGDCQIMDQSQDGAIVHFYSDSGQPAQDHRAEIAPTEYPPSGYWVRAWSMPGGI